MVWGLSLICVWCFTDFFTRYVKLWFKICNDDEWHSSQGNNQSERMIVSLMMVNIPLTWSVLDTFLVFMDSVFFLSVVFQFLFYLLWDIVFFILLNYFLKHVCGFFNFQKPSQPAPLILRAWMLPRFCDAHTVSLL